MLTRQLFQRLASTGIEVGGYSIVIFQLFEPSLKAVTLDHNLVQVVAVLASEISEQTLASLDLLQGQRIRFDCFTDFANGIAEVVELGHQLFESLGYRVKRLAFGNLGQGNSQDVPGSLIVH